MRPNECIVVDLRKYHTVKSLINYIKYNKFTSQSHTKYRRELCGLLEGSVPRPTTAMLRTCNCMCVCIACATAKPLSRTPSGTELQATLGRVDQLINHWVWIPIPHGQRTPQCVHTARPHLEWFSSGSCVGPPSTVNRDTCCNREKKTRDLAGRCQLWANCSILTRTLCQIPPTFTVRGILANSRQNQPTTNY